MLTCLRFTVSFGAAVLLGCPQTMLSEADGGKQDGGDLPDGSSSAFDAGRTCPTEAPHPVARFEEPFGGDTLMVGGGLVMSWSHHHYTWPIMASEVWWPWCLVGPRSALCASSSPFNVYWIPDKLPAVGPSHREILRGALPMAGTLELGVLYAFDGGELHRVGPDGGVTATSITLPVPWARSDVRAADDGASAPLAALAGQRLAWVGEDHSVRETSLASGVTSTLNASGFPVTAIAVSDQLVAWRTGDTLAVRTNDGTVVTHAVGTTKPGIAARGGWVTFSDGDTVRALTVDGGSHALALDAGTIYGFATEGCYFYALTASGDVYRFSLP